MNTVIAGDYSGKTLDIAPGTNTVRIYYSGLKCFPVNKDTVAEYAVVNAESKSGFSVGKAVAGAAVFGDLGVAAGVGGKDKSSYQVDIRFRDGKRSLLELDGKFYKALTTELFGLEDYTPISNPLPSAKPVVMKSKWVSFFLCLFFGIFGAHKFYEGKIGMGFLYFFTVGLFLIGWIADIIMILKKPDPYPVSK